MLAQLALPGGSEGESTPRLSPHLPPRLWLANHPWHPLARGYIAPTSYMACTCVLGRGGIPPAKFNMTLS